MLMSLMFSINIVGEYVGLIWINILTVGRICEFEHYYMNFTPIILLDCDNFRCYAIGQ